MAHEKKAGDFVRGLIRNGDTAAVHDLSDGGLAVALAEMAMASGIGATIGQPEGGDAIAEFFGEDQGRYLVALAFAASDKRFADLEARAKELGISATVIGTTGGRELKLGKAHAISLEELSTAHESWFPRFMGN